MKQGLERPVARKPVARRPVTERPVAERLVVHKMGVHRPDAQEEQWWVVVSRVGRGRGFVELQWGIEGQESGFRGKRGGVVRCGGWREVESRDRLVGRSLLWQGDGLMSAFEEERKCRGIRSTSLAS